MTPSELLSIKCAVCELPLLYTKTDKGEILVEVCEKCEDEIVYQTQIDHYYI